MIEFGNVSHGKIIMDAMNSRFSLDVMTVIGNVVEDKVIGDELLGGVVYENYTGRGGSIVMHMAGFHPRWISRDMLWVCFHYPFVQLDCNQVFGQARGSNLASRKIIKGLGYKYVMELDNVWPGDSMILYRMRRDECKYLNLKPRNLAYRRMN